VKIHRLLGPRDGSFLADRDIWTDAAQNDRAPDIWPGAEAIGPIRTWRAGAAMPTVGAGSHAGDKEVAVRSVLIGAVVAALAGFGTQAAVGNHYHTTCVGNGLVHGTSTTDNSYHSRVESDGVSGGCGDGMRTCTLYTGSTLRGGGTAYDPTTCNFWVGSGTECLGSAHVDFDGAWASHVHYAHNWCG
jgi:hypothetical protein